MIFPFTFNFSVPGIINPFSLTHSRTGASASTTVDVQNQTGSVGVKTPSQPLPQTQSQQLRLIEGLRSQSITPPVLVSRKRGWEPAFAEESSPGTTLENSTGYLVTGMPSSAEYHEVVDTEELPPPAKRRRGLAGSIVSTAISAALIGTAVGLTVYRLWRDRGNSASPNPKSNLDPSTPERSLPPPPPYQESERTPGQPSTLHKQRRQRPVPTHSHSRRTHLHRSTRPRGSIPSTLTATPTGRQGAPLLLSNQTGSELEEPQHEVETQMDWFGDKLSALIAEGKRALGREIVVMSDAKEDEVDDGSGAWEDSDQDRMSDSDSRMYHSPSQSQRTPDNTRRRRRLASPTGSINNSASKTSPRKARSRSQKRHQHVVSPLSTASCSSSPTKAGSFFGFESAGPSTTASSAQGGYFQTGVSQLSRHAYSASTPCLPNPVSSSTPYHQLPPSSAPPLQPTTPVTPMTPRRTHDSRACGLSLDSSSSPGWTGSEDLTSFDSPELKDLMERARQKALMTRASRMSMRDGEL
ncbi:hypothetical protein JOM56_007227 [Amanita muscaria]